jgi:hypothetical protein
MFPAGEMILPASLLMKINVFWKAIFTDVSEVHATIFNPK